MIVIEPHIAERPSQPYVALRAGCDLSSIGRDLPPLMSVLARWLAERGLAPSGPPFWKYDVLAATTSESGASCDMVVEVGWPVEAPVPAEGDVVGGTLPGGSYATLRHQGHPAELYGATGYLLAWADREGVAWDKRDVGASEHWGARLEVYLSDPTTEPDMSCWETELAFRVAQAQPAGKATSHTRSDSAADATSAM